MLAVCNLPLHDLIGLLSIVSFNDGFAENGLYVGNAILHMEKGEGTMEPRLLGALAELPEGKVEPEDDLAEGVR